MPAAAAATPEVAVAQPAPPPPPQPVVKVLPANTELTLAMNDTITSKGKRWSEGDNFDMTVTHDVMIDNFVVIPKFAWRWTHLLDDQ